MNNFILSMLTATALITTAAVAMETPDDEKSRVSLRTAMTSEEIENVRKEFRINDVKEVPLEEFALHCLIDAFAEPDEDIQHRKLKLIIDRDTPWKERAYIYLEDYMNGKTTITELNDLYKTMEDR